MDCCFRLPHLLCFPANESHLRGAAPRREDALPPASPSAVPERPAHRLTPEPPLGSLSAPAGRSAAPHLVRPSGPGGDVGQRERRDGAGAALRGAVRQRAGGEVHPRVAAVARPQAAGAAAQPGTPQGGAEVAQRRRRLSHQWMHFLVIIGAYDVSSIRGGKTENSVDAF